VICLMCKLRMDPKPYRWLALPTMLMGINVGFGIALGWWLFQLVWWHR